MKVLNAVVSLVCLGSVAALADLTPNCSDPKSTVEFNYCAGEEYKAADAELNRVYKIVKNNMKNSDKGAAAPYNQQEASLVKAQLLWIQLRDADCKVVRDMWSNGTGATAAYLWCLSAKTRERTDFLFENFLTEN